MKNHEQKLIESNITAAIDQADTYDDTPNWREGDAYLQNVFDAAIADGLAPAEAMRTADAFIALARQAGVRFA